MASKFWAASDSSSSSEEEVAEQGFRRNVFDTSSSEEEDLRVVQSAADKCRQVTEACSIAVNAELEKGDYAELTKALERLCKAGLQWLHLRGRASHAWAYAWAEAEAKVLALDEDTREWKKSRAQAYNTVRHRVVKMVPEGYEEAVALARRGALARDESEPEIETEDAPRKSALDAQLREVLERIQRGALTDETPALLVSLLQRRRVKSFEKKLEHCRHLRQLIRLLTPTDGTYLFVLTHYVHLCLGQNTQTAETSWALDALLTHLEEKTGALAEGAWGHALAAQFTLLTPDAPTARDFRLLCTDLASFVGRLCEDATADPAIAGANALRAWTLLHKRGFKRSAACVGGYLAGLAVKQEDSFWPLARASIPLYSNVEVTLDMHVYDKSVTASSALDKYRVVKMTGTAYTLCPMPVPKGETPAPDALTPSLFMLSLCKAAIVANTNPVTALLHKIYILALGGEYHLTRQLLSSHGVNQRQEAAGQLLVTVPQPAPLSTQLLHNQCMAQVGMAAFGQGLYVECHEMLHELFWNNRQRELLGGTRVHLDSLEVCHLVSAMLIEIPLIAQNPFAFRKRPTSKLFMRVAHPRARQPAQLPNDGNRDVVLAAARALLRGDWKACQETLARLASWPLLAHVHDLYSQFIKLEALKTHVNGRAYTTLRLDSLAAAFELPEDVLRPALTKMIFQKQVTATWNQTDTAIIIKKSHLTPLQGCAEQLADALLQAIDAHEITVQVKTAKDHSFKYSKGNRKRWTQNQWHTDGGNYQRAR